ncbi:HD domain-containing protein [Loigolactobacillus zhaoyuanensis]|uniref:HD domain-containing protein n=1 Tax=Loigolactobacillus zhaoyuanensis TaxID=2486017 RepID=UPI000F74B5DF|nr:HD domain-containing protein [Loigolactobacillus zhaoyuanensis]
MNELQQQQLAAATTYMQQVLGSDHSGHSVDHIQRVVHLTTTLCQQEQVAAFVPLMAATLHDVIDDKVVSDVEQARQALSNFLGAQQVSTADQNEIWLIIDRLSFSKNLDQKQELPLNGQIVQDADRLDAIGAIGIARTFYYGGHTGAPLYDPAVKPRTQLDKATYRKQSPVINHFYEKLLLLQDSMNTASAKKIAAQRQQVMLTFLDEFKAEWQGES